MVFWDVILAILVWRLFSSLEPVDYDEIRDIVKKEIRNSKHKKKREKTK